MQECGNKWALKWTHRDVSGCRTNDLVTYEHGAARKTLTFPIWEVDIRPIVWQQSQQLSTSDLSLFSDWNVRADCLPSATAGQSQICGPQVLENQPQLTDSVAVRSEHLNSLRLSTEETWIVTRPARRRAGARHLHYASFIIMSQHLSTWRWVKILTTGEY